MTKFNKALVAAFTAGSAVYVAAAILNSPLEQLGAALVAGALAGFAVWRVPNAPSEPVSPKGTPLA